MPSASGYTAIGRLFWMMIGPAILFLLALAIARNGGGWFTAVDFWFLIILGGMVLGRFVEFRGGEPRTADGQPASPAHLRRYSALVLTVGLGVWAVANLVGNR